MIELDTPEGQQRLREYYEAIGLQVTTIDGAYVVTPAAPQSFLAMSSADSE